MKPRFWIGEVVRLSEAAATKVQGPWEEAAKQTGVVLGVQFPRNRYVYHVLWQHQHRIAGPLGTYPAEYLREAV